MGGKIILGDIYDLKIESHLNNIPGQRLVVLVMWCIARKKGEVSIRLHLEDSRKSNQPSTIPCIIHTRNDR